MNVSRVFLVSPQVFQGIRWALTTFLRHYQTHPLLYNCLYYRHPIMKRHHPTCASGPLLHMTYPSSFQGNPHRQFDFLSIASPSQKKTYGLDDPNQPFQPLSNKPLSNIAAELLDEILKFSRNHVNSCQGHKRRRQRLLPCVQGLRGC